MLMWLCWASGMVKKGNVGVGWEDLDSFNLGYVGPTCWVRQMLWPMGLGKASSLH